MRGEKIKIRVAHLDKRVDDSFLACTAELVDKDMALADDIEKLCTELSFDVKDSGKPMEALFGGKYVLNEFTIEAPKPADWKFSNYSMQWGRVSFKRGFGTKLELGATCGGRCKEDLFATAIENESKQDFESMGRDGEATWVKPFTEVKPGTWMHRIRRTKDGQPDEEHIKVATIRKGAEHYFYCRVELSKDNLGLADSMETYCLDRAAEAAR